MAKQELQSFFYTFGTSDFFPYQKGWVEVKAPNRQEADTLFRKHYPDHTEGSLNCSDVYDQTSFDAMRESNIIPSDWDVCHKVISHDNIVRPKPLSHLPSELSSERPEPVRTCFADQIQNAQNRADTGLTAPSTKTVPER